MRLIHTLLFLLREDRLLEDLILARKCLESLEKSTYTTVVVYNQGFWSNDELKVFLNTFNLECIVIGNGENVGTSAGRQSCFEYIWKNYPDNQFMSELHLDMIFTHHWEDALVEYLDTNDEPMVSCGIVDHNGFMSFLQTSAGPVPDTISNMYDYLDGLKQNTILHGFTNPCIHKSDIIKATGGYNTRFLIGKQAFEDDSMLLGYYYYYGTKANWKPKVCYQSVVYHAVAGQRMSMQDGNVMINYGGLIKQYGATGLKHLSELHTSQWHINFFSEQYNSL